MINFNCIVNAVYNMAEWGKKKKKNIQPGDVNEHAENPELKPLMDID